MRKYLIHLQAIYPPIVASSVMCILAITSLTYIPLVYGHIARVLFWFFVVWSFLFILDAIQRFRHYLSAVKYIDLHAPDIIPILEHEKIAWCTRESVLAACRQHSELLYRQALKYYHEQGIRYYHILPTDIFSKNSSLFKISFWKAAFFDFRTKDYLGDLK